jgi:mRNA-degrading endonuclease toxin of MazEF toxin-antitoxin module
MPLDKGDIYWVTLTGNGSEQRGRRPCIVMSRPAVNNALNTVLIVPLTTSEGPHQAFRIRIPVSQMIRDINCKSELEPSIAKCDQVRVLDKSLLENKIGRLTQTAIAAVELGIAFVFDV